MKNNFILETSQEYFCNWIRDFTRDVTQRNFPTEKCHISLQPARQQQIGYSGNFHMCLCGHYLSPPVNDTQTAFPIDTVIEFKVIPLNHNRIEIFAECSQSAVESYYHFLLLEISKRWSQTQTAEKQFSEVQVAVLTSLSGIKESQNSLIKIEEKLSKVMESIHNGQIEQGDMIRTLDAIRRALKYLQRQKLSLSNEENERVFNSNEILESKIDIQQKVELTLPILPLFLKYKIELGVGGEINIDNIYKEIQANLLSLLEKS